MKIKEQALLELKEQLDAVGTKFNGLTWQRIDKAMEEYAAQFQPKWIKINSESDLPKEKGDYWIANENGVFDFIASIDQIKAKFENNTCTHYMRVFKPQPPKED